MVDWWLDGGLAVEALIMEDRRVDICRGSILGTHSPITSLPATQHITQSLWTRKAPSQGHTSLCTHGAGKIYEEAIMSCVLFHISSKRNTSIENISLEIKQVNQTVSVL